MSVQQCQILLDGDQVGQAYVQYLRASEIVVNLVPRHADYRTLHAQHPKLYAQFQKLMMVSCSTLASDLYLVSHDRC